MMIKRSNLMGIGGALCALLIFTGCKPTEKNYRSAYEIALQKKEKDKASADPEEEGMIRTDAPRTEKYNGTQIRTLNEHLLVDGKTPVSQPLNVAVCLFKMPTNARAGAAAFTKEGYKGFAAKSYGDRWFLIIGSADSMEEAVKIADKFKKKHPDYPYIGLDGAPVIIRQY